MSADRASGVFFLLFGLLMYLWAIPAGVDNIPDGNLNPNALPNTLSLGLVLFGAVVAIRPTGHQLQDVRYLVRAGIFTGLLAVALYVMTLVGFLPVAPVLALIVMLMIGERRPVWLISGAVLMPAAIWLLVTQVLDRALP